MPLPADSINEAVIGREMAKKRSIYLRFRKTEKGEQCDDDEYGM